MTEEINQTDAKSAPADRQTAGPFDLGEVTDISPTIDLGSIRIVPRPNLELKLELDEASKRVVAVSVEIAESKLQLQAFAAPRSSGLWHEIRNQISEQITNQGGVTKVEESLLGPQLLAEIPVQTPDATVVKQQVRFLGVDGPRWFLRGVVSGKAVTDQAAWNEISTVFRSTIVVRSSTPMPPKDLLPLKLPGTQLAQESHHLQ
ncbi:MAG: DUF3710 domain-containing protein [Microbacteriaceae bacterium]